MDFAALVISIVSAAATVAAAVAAGISIRISRRATTAAEASAAEARRSADAGEGTHGIELERHYEQARPGLEGRVVRSGVQSDRLGHRLEIWLKTPEPLVWVTLAVPADVGFDLGLSGMQFDLTCPDPAAGERVTIKTREVISWPVRLSGSAHGTVVVTARCRSDAGTSWDGIQVAIDLGTPEREQAENVGLHMGYGSFPDWTEEDVAGFRVSPGERVHMAFVSNESRRPIQNVVCKFASLTAVMAGRVAEQRDPVQDLLG